jgi:hypothetical protein
MSFFLLGCELFKKNITISENAFIEPSVIFEDNQVSDEISTFFNSYEIEDIILHEGIFVVLYIAEDGSNNIAGINDDEVLWTIGPFRLGARISRYKDNITVRIIEGSGESSYGFLTSDGVITYQYKNPIFVSKVENGFITVERDHIIVDHSYSRNYLYTISRIYENYREVFYTITARYGMKIEELNNDNYAISYKTIEDKYIFKIIDIYGTEIISIESNDEVTYQQALNGMLYMYYTDDSKGLVTKFYNSDGEDLSPDIDMTNKELAFTNNRIVLFEDYKSIELLDFEFRSRGTYNLDFNYESLVISTSDYIVFTFGTLSGNNYAKLEYDGTFTPYYEYTPENTTEIFVKKYPIYNTEDQILYYIDDATTFLSRIDKDEKEIWNLEFEGKYSFVEINDDIIYISNSWEESLVKVSTEGKIIETQELLCRLMIVTDDGGYICSANYGLVRYDRDLNIIWEREYLQIYTIEVVVDGNIIVTYPDTKAFDLIDLGFAIYNGAFDLISPNGDLIKVFNKIETSDYNDIIPYGLIFIYNDNTFFTGSYEDMEAHNYTWRNSLLFEIDEEGTIINEHKILCSYNIEGYSVLLIKDKDIITSIKIPIDY